MLRGLETPFHSPLEPELRMNRERYYSNIWGLKGWSILRLLVSFAIVLNSQFQSDLRCLLFWNVTQGRLVVRYRRFGTIYWYNLQGSTSTRIGVISSFKIPVTGPTVRYSAARANYPLTPNDPYSGRTTPLTSKRCILYIYSTNIGTEYF